MLANRLSELLIRDKILTPDGAEKALEEARSKGLRFVDAVLNLNLVDERSLINFLSKQNRLTIMDLANHSIPEDLAKLVPASLCRKHKIVPVAKRDDCLIVAVSDPTNIHCLDDLRFQTKLRIEQVLGLPSSINALLDKVYGVDIAAINSDMDKELSGIEMPTDGSSDENDVNPDDGPIVAFVSKLLTDAAKKGASDIHIEPFEGAVKVRIRIDGNLSDLVNPPPKIKNALVARIKVMAKLRIDEKRLPQDGRIRIKLDEKRIIDYRVNTLPTVFGEKVVLRILDKSNASVDVEKLGFEKDDLDKFRKAYKKPWGMCLVTGATGSGKTTTLYSVLNELNLPDVNISTLEDPVEYNFKGINQTPIREAIGLTFPEGLRALLRQDPDIILLGEIRDKETAEVAMKAALTGHMVLSTLHTNDAPSTIMRLKDMGLDVFTINAALQAIVAQRLVRKVCSHCKAPDTQWSDESLEKMGFPRAILGKFKPMKGQGCGTCGGAGYKGRLAVHEVLLITDTLRELVGSGASTLQIRRQAVAEGMRTLKVNCMRKVVNGLTTIEELQGVDAG